MNSQSQNSLNSLKFLRYGVRAGIPFGLVSGGFMSLVAGWEIGVVYGVLSGAFLAAGLSAFLIVCSRRKASS